MTHVQRHFTSTSALREYYINTPGPISHELFNDSDRKRNVAKALTALEHGSQDYISLIEHIRDEVWETAIPTFHHTWQPSVYGAFPNIPAFLAGQPEAMFSLEPDQGPFAPMRIFMGLTSSMGISESILAKRGAALGALASALSSVRQVFITPYAINASYDARDTALLSWDISTSPIVLSELAACLVNPSVVRHLTLNACYLLNEHCHGGWPTWKDNTTKLREMLGASDDDLIFPTVYLTDPMVNDPVSQVKSYLAKYAVED